MITITETEFMKFSGILLSNELPGLDDDSNKVNRVIKLWTRRVYDVIRASTRAIPPDDRLSDFQIESIKEAICEYGMYYLKNGDLYRQSGFDEDKGMLSDPENIKKIQFPPICMDYLRRAGLIKRSIGKRFVYSQEVDSYFY